MDGTTRMALRVLTTTLLVASAGCSLRSSKPTEESAPKAEDADHRHLALAEVWGWKSEYTRGQAMICTMEGLRPEEREHYDITAFRGESVAFFGWIAPSGGTNDLLTRNGYLLRIVNVDNKDLRPQAAWWTVMVRGKVQQVLPANRIIVLEVDEGDWRILQTG